MRSTYFLAARFLPRNRALMTKETTREASMTKETIKEVVDLWNRCRFSTVLDVVGAAVVDVVELVVVVVVVVAKIVVGFAIPPP
jgi:hypothetical protein